MIRVHARIPRIPFAVNVFTDIRWQASYGDVRRKQQRISRARLQPRRSPDLDKHVGVWALADADGAADREVVAPPGRPADLPTTLSALDAMLGVQPDLQSGQSLETEESPVIDVPLLWKGAQSAGASVSSALSERATSPPVEFMALTLKFPKCATASQAERGVAGVELDFVLDTACSADFILPEVALGLRLQVVGETPGGVAATGSIAGGPLVRLGDVELGSTLIIEGFVATALLLPTAGTAGILGKRFLDCFDAVELAWAQRPGRARFHQEYDWEAAMSYMSCVDLQELANGLLACEISIDGVVVQGLLDTGAPQSIVNCALAKLLGIERPPPPAPAVPKNHLDRLKSAITRGVQPLPTNGIMVAGAGGMPMRLEYAERSVGATIGGADIKDVRLLVGDLPVFIDGLLLEEGVPGIVLGLDILAKLPSLVLSTKSRKMLVPIPGATKPAVAVEDGAESGK
mmetsp:Transcript_49472/g.92151  ORF Transcript_49472/g.92151 Transcript_49472/m.92151 type:complete len:461 (+) Transcript_49472:114-1496(+)